MDTPLKHMLHESEIAILIAIYDVHRTCHDFPDHQWTDLAKDASYDAYETVMVRFFPKWKEWCETNGHAPSMLQFHREVRLVWISWKMMNTPAAVLFVNIEPDPENPTDPESPTQN